MSKRIFLAILSRKVVEILWVLIEVPKYRFNLFIKLYIVLITSTFS